MDESQHFMNLAQGRPPTSVYTKEDEDPLGLSDEGNSTKYTEEQLLEYFPEGIMGNVTINSEKSI